jgi:hypothetical protein
MNLSTTWKAFFNSRATNADGNKSPGSYLSAWNNDSTPESKLSLLANDPSLAVLAGEPGNGITILHSFKNLGGTILAPADKFVCLIGSNQTAPIVIVNEIALADTSDIVTPSAEDILACATLEELLDLTAPLVEDNEDTITFHGINTFLPCPWLLNTIINARTNDPFKLILAVKEGAALFNTNQQSTIPDYTPNTAQTVEHFVMWAWGIKKGLIPPTTYFFDPNDEDTETYHIARHQQCIKIHAPLVLPLLPLAGPVPPGGPAPLFNQNANEAVLQQLVHSISRQSDEAAAANELMTRQLEFNLEKDDKKKDRIKKLHQAVKQLILFASAEDADSVPDEPLESCKRFLNAETDGIADQELNMQFKNLNLNDAAFSIGFTQALYNGKFLWADSGTPSNFSPFCIFEVEPLLAAEQQNRHFTLHIVQTQGKGRTIDEIKSSSKQEVKAPTTYIELTQQLNYFAGACQIFFGEHSAATTSIRAIVVSIEKYKQIFKAREVRETVFVSKFLFAIDTRMQMWLDECMTQPARNLVDDSILNFNTLIDSVRFNNFDICLPPTFIATASKEDKAATGKKNKGGPEGTNDKNDAKKPRTKVDNPSQPEQFKLRAGEVWATQFAGKMAGRVIWEETPPTQYNIFMCARWFIGGYCFSGCHNIKSHVALSQVPEDKITAFSAYMSTCRGETRTT